MLRLISVLVVLFLVVIITIMAIYFGLNPETIEISFTNVAGKSVTRTDFIGAWIGILSAFLTIFTAANAFAYFNFQNKLKYQAKIDARRIGLDYLKNIPIDIESKINNNLRMVKNKKLINTKKLKKRKSRSESESFNKKQQKKIKKILKKGIKPKYLIGRLDI